MSISGSLFNAYSGLAAASRTASAISQNVSNALTEGYGRREVELSAASLDGRGTGVRVNSVTRAVDQVAISNRRLAQSQSGQSDIRSDAYARLESVIGIPGESGSLTDLVTDLEAAFVQAESRPDSQVRLQNVVFAARDLVSGLNSISTATQDLRMTADQEIADQVGTLNRTLADITDLNRDIRLQISAGNDTNGLQDQRQLLIDRIAGMMPVKTFPRDNGQIALVSSGGAVLVDGQPAEFGFTPVGSISADMSLDSGALSGLTLNGKALKVGNGGLVDGGSLSALFNVRDNIAPDASAQADAFARTLMERFETSGLGPSLPSGAAGLFTDAGLAFNGLDEIGLAGRVTLNAAVDPDTGGALWRIRDGLGALTPGDVGDRSLLTGFISAISQKTVASSGQFSTAALSLNELAGDLTALNSGARLEAEDSQVFAQARFQELQMIEMESGVDTDQEMQKLLFVQILFKKNSRIN